MAITWPFELGIGPFKSLIFPQEVKNPFLCFVLACYMEFIRVKAFFLSVGRLDAATSEDPLYVEVEADFWESEQGKSHHP